MERIIKICHVSLLWSTAPLLLTEDKLLSVKFLFFDAAICTVKCLHRGDMDNALFVFVHREREWRGHVFTLGRLAAAAGP